MTATAATRQPQQAVDARRKSTVAFEAALGIARLWGLTDEQLSVLLGGVGRATLHRWKAQLAAGGRISTEFGPDTLDRVSYLVGIHKALRILFMDAAQADGWVKRPNDGLGFGGRSALERMLGGRMEDLRYVRRYLDGWRG